ncbi:helix-turn-helix transcriptional regulator [Marinobacter sp. SBS5]|uniref:helix-turn-helix transcriptional regulator n=1 Tax=Marinobacter sp. SBS5 TaxID=3401754 RepID=UPI003AADB784
MLVDSVDGCAAQLSFIRRTPRAIEHIWHAGLSDEFLTWYLDNNMIEHDAVTNHAVTQQAGTFNSALPLLHDGPPGDDYGRWESDQDMLDSAWLVVEASDSHITLLTVQRTYAQGAYQPEEIAAMNRLVPFIKQTVALAKKIHQHPEAAQTLSSIAELITDPAFILNNRGTLVTANQRGEQLLDQESCINLRHGRLYFETDQLRKSFFKAMARAAETVCSEDLALPETLIVKRHALSPLVMTIRPLEHNEILSGGVLVTIVDLKARALPSAEEIVKYFPLSAAEGKLCEGLVAGLSLKEIAEHHHKSEATVRSYLKQVFQKTGYNRQGQLISAILLSTLR